MQNLIERAGIDRTVICSFALKSINSELMRNEQNNGVDITLDSCVDHEIGLHVPDNATEQLAGIKRLKLSTNDVGDLSIEWYKNNLTGQQYPQCRLALNISNDGNNLQNLNALEYRQRIRDVFYTLKYKYGIIVDYSTVAIRQIEVNVTVKLNHEINAYRNVLGLMALNLPDYIYGNEQNKVKIALWFANNQQNQTTELETIYVKNNNIEMKLYNKIQQLVDTGVLPEQTDNILRIEYKLKDKDTIVNAFGSTAVTAITDEAIANLFWKYFYRDVVKPWERWHKANLQNVASLMCQYVNADKRYYLNDFIRECRQYERLNGYPLLFDVEDIRYALKVAKGSRGLSKRYFKIKARLTHEADLFGNIDKMNEIIGKVEQACKVSPGVE